MGIVAGSGRVGRACRFARTRSRRQTVQTDLPGIRDSRYIPSPLHAPPAPRGETDGKERESREDIRVSKANLRTNEEGSIGESYQVDRQDTVAVPAHRAQRRQ